VPQGDARAVISDEDVAAVSTQGLEPGLDFRQREWQAVGRQVQAFGVGELPVPTKNYIR
jgi:hypothetical protein